MAPGPGAREARSQALDFLLPPVPSQARPLRRREALGPRGVLAHGKRHGLPPGRARAAQRAGALHLGQDRPAAHARGGPALPDQAEEVRSYRGDQGKAARNVLDRDFSPDAPMRKLVTDIAEFHQPWGKAYLSPVMDLYNNEIVAWSVSEHPNMAQINEMMAYNEATYSTMGAIRNAGI